jgi:hypothetical protein
MAIEVKQLTINSTLQRNPSDSEDTIDSENAKESNNASKAEQSPCLDPEQIKAEVLMACRKLISQAMNDQRRR